MWRKVWVAGVIVWFPLVAVAGGGHGKTEDCGAFIRSKAPLPAKISELVTQVAANMAGHAKWMQSNKDVASRAEVRFLKDLARQQRAVAAALKRISVKMAAAKFPPAPHDVAKMPQQMGATMSKQSQLSKEVAELLQNESRSIDKMLAQMKAKKTAMAK